MRKVVTETFLTLDGLIVGAQEEMDWVSENFDDEMGLDIDARHEAADAILVGRVTYEILAGYWPTAGPEEGPLATSMNTTKKFVFSRTLQSADWENTTIVKGDLATEVAHLKEQPGHDMLIIGSASIVQALSAARLIDAYHLMLHPVLLGSGKPLFASGVRRTNLKLAGSKTYKNGVVRLDYAPADVASNA